MISVPPGESTESRSPAVLPPTGSSATGRGRPAAAVCTWSTQPGSEVETTGTEGKPSRSCWARCSLRTMLTVAIWWCSAIAVNSRPTEEAAALLSTTPSNPTLKCSCAARRSISAVIGLHSIWAATSSGTESGTGTAVAASMLRTWHHAPWWGKKVTRVPGLKPVTPAPSPVTTPVASIPAICSSPEVPGADTAIRSPGWIGNALTLTRS